MRILYHDDGRIDHGADGDGDAAQRHNVGVDPLVAHDDEGGEDTQGQRDDGHQRRAQMKQKQHAYHRDHNELLEQFMRQRVDGAPD